MNNDLISRSALKKAFEDTVCVSPMPYAFVKQIIDNAPTVYPICEDKACKYRANERPHGEWIPVSERLPEKIGTYLVTLEYNEHGKGITTLWYHGNDNGWDLRVADVVTAWQPLPEAY